jgi:hypothetical protein
MYKHPFDEHHMADMYVSLVRTTTQRWRKLMSWKKRRKGKKKLKTMVVES